MKETEDYIVIELTSAMGNKYEVGYPKSAGYTMETLKTELAKNQPDLASAGFREIKWISDGSSFTSKGAIDLGIVGAFASPSSRKPGTVTVGNG